MPLQRREFDVRDSRGLLWRASLSGPVRAGSLAPGAHLDTLPEHYLLRLRPEGRGEHEITIDLSAGDVDAAEARSLLEQEPAWQYEPWARATGTTVTD